MVTTGSTTFNAVKIICVGADPQLLESRRLVLQVAGYEASCHLPSGALTALRVKTFDIMIVSASVSQEDRVSLAEAAPDRMHVIQLNKFVSPRELLTLVETEAKELRR